MLIERGTEPRAAWCRTKSDACLPACIKVADISLNELETLPLFRGYPAFHLITVVPKISGKIVKACTFLLQ